MPLTAALSPLHHCRLCLLQYEKEQHSSTAFMDLFNKLNVTLSDEQLSVFLGAHGRLPASRFRP